MSRKVELDFNKREKKRKGLTNKKRWSDSFHCNSIINYYLTHYYILAIEVKHLC